MLPIRIWDESRLAINAYEMNKNGNWLVTHFEGSPDLWNTKPPFLIWMQVIFIKMIGIGELAIRLPSAIAAFLTCISLLIISVKYLKNFTFGFISALVLVTSHGYMDCHAARFGDYDAMLTFLTTISGLFFLCFLEKKQNKYLYLFFICLALAVLTKGITPLIFLPAFLFYTVWQRQFMTIIKNKHLYFGLLLFLFITLTYYLLRELNSPGYLKAVQENELGGRYLNAIESHEGGFLFYFYNIINFQLAEWYLLIPCGLAMGLVSKNDRIKKLTVFSTLMVLVFFIVISTAKTKLQWYDVPMYPFISIIIAAIIYVLFNTLKNLTVVNNIIRVNLLPFVFLFLLFITPYQKIIHSTQIDPEYPWDKDFYELGRFLKDALKETNRVNNFYLLRENHGYRPHVDFYLKIFRDRGVNFNLKDFTTLAIGDSVITVDSNIKDYLTNHYSFETLGHYNNVVKYKITGLKKP